MYKNQHLNLLRLTFTASVGVFAAEVAGSRDTQVTSPTLDKQFTETVSCEGVTGQVHAPGHLTITGSTPVKQCTVLDINFMH